MKFNPKMEPQHFVSYLKNDYQKDKEEIIALGGIDYKKSREMLMQFQSALRYKALSHRHWFEKKLGEHGKEEYKKLIINDKTPLAFVRNEYHQTLHANNGMRLVLSLSHLGQARFFISVPDIGDILSPIRIMPKEIPPSASDTKSDSKKKCF